MSKKGAVEGSGSGTVSQLESHHFPCGSSNWSAFFPHPFIVGGYCLLTDGQVDVDHILSYENM